MAIRTFLTLDEYDALERAAEQYGGRLRYLVRDAVLDWIRYSEIGAESREHKPGELRRELQVLVDGMLYKALKEKSIAGGFHMRQGLRDAILQWLAKDALGQVSPLTDEGDALWMRRRGAWEVLQPGGIAWVRPEHPGPE